jgi:hypothetical protein
MAWSSSRLLAWNWVKESSGKPRKHSLAVGRWDSEGLLGARSGHVNLYRVVRNLPAGATDPGGKDEKPFVFPGIQWDMIGDQLNALSPADQAKARDYFRELYGVDVTTNAVRKRKYLAAVITEPIGVSGAFACSFRYTYGPKQVSGLLVQHVKRTYEIDGKLAEEDEVVEGVRICEGSAVKSDHHLGVWNLVHPRHTGEVVYDVSIGVGTYLPNPNWDGNNDAFEATGGLSAIQWKPGTEQLKYKTTFTFDCFGRWMLTGPGGISASGRWNVEGAG